MTDYLESEPFLPAEGEGSRAGDLVPPEQQQLFEESLRAAHHLVDSPGSGQSGLWLLLSLVAFVLASLGGFNWQGIALLVAVLFFHEAGHFAGMKLFGYRDVKMFFIPFFGAAVTGKKHAVAAWKEIIVLLLGPLPGLILGTVLYAVLRPADTKSVAFQAVSMLLLLNAFNLLPFMPLDGGRIMNLLIFRRHPILEVLFKLFAVAGLLLCAWLLWSPMLAVIGFLTLITIPFGYRVAARARKLRIGHPSIAAEWNLLGLHELRQLFLYARELLPGDRVPINVAKRMIMLHEQSAATSPGALATLLYLVVYAVSFFVGPAVGVVIALNLREKGALANPVERPTMAKLIEESRDLLDQARSLAAEAEASPLTTARVRDLANQADEKLNRATVLLLRDQQLDEKAKSETLRQLMELRRECFELSGRLDEGLRNSDDPRARDR